MKCVFRSGLIVEAVEYRAVVADGMDRAKFGTPETTLRGKRICVTGMIESYRSVPEIVVRNPSAIQVTTQ